jgi:hypothetical protein
MEHCEKPLWKICEKFGVCIPLLYDGKITTAQRGEIVHVTLINHTPNLELTIAMAARVSSSSASIDELPTKLTLVPNLSSSAIVWVTLIRCRAVGCIR